MCRARVLAISLYAIVTTDRFDHSISHICCYTRYGQPPAEIVKELAPGLEFDKDGMPKIDPSAGAPIPGMNEECSIM